MMKSSPEKKTVGSSSTQRQFHHKSEKRKKNNTNCKSDADSGESEKEDVAMDVTKEEINKVLCFLATHVHAAWPLTSFPL